MESALRRVGVAPGRGLDGPEVVPYGRKLVSGIVERRCGSRTPPSPGCPNRVFEVQLSTEGQDEQGPHTSIMEEKTGEISEPTEAAMPFGRLAPECPAGNRHQGDLWDGRKRSECRK
jgi:hypothetical protein